jgi:integrase/recombinase XerD
MRPPQHGHGGFPACSRWKRWDGCSKPRPAPGLKYKAALSVAYEAGLRVSEVVMLRVMLIYVEQGKGRKDRYAMLSLQLLELLRAWWRQCRSKGWLFPGQSSAGEARRHNRSGRRAPYQARGRRYCTALNQRTS